MAVLCPTFFIIVLWFLSFSILLKILDVFLSKNRLNYEILFLKLFEFCAITIIIRVFYLTLSIPISCQIHSFYFKKQEFGIVCYKNMDLFFLKLLSCFCMILHRLRGSLDFYQSKDQQHYLIIRRRTTQFLVNDCHYNVQPITISSELKD